ncbi:peptidoglycan bridge formation glycyltransferase FemA/FemB family protein [Candidatus Puniceispirillum sp.]|nr:peptidoglycan bridge formation glycyltransferase FemA/FemB family protein [Candidatus Puniceispirillum sp.]
MTFVPLPTWKGFVDFLPGKKGNVEVARSHFTRDNDAFVGWLSKSAYSFALVAECRKKKNINKSVIVWVPEYFCEVSLAPLREVGAKIFYYPIDEKLEPKYSSVYKMSTISVPDIFIFVHYFGFAKPIAKAREFCQKTGAWLVEDATHCFPNNKAIGTEGDFVFYSPHKILPIPDGAVLLAQSTGASKLNVDILSGLSLKEYVFNNKKNFVNNRFVNHNILWFIKRLLQKFGFRSKKIPLMFNDDASVFCWQTVKISDVSLRAIPKLLSAQMSVCLSRELNLKILDELVEMNPQLGLRPSLRSPQSEGTPYWASYSSLNSKKSFKILNEMGIPVSSWPDLNSNCKMDSNDHSTALRLRNENMFLPIHQSLKGHDLLSWFSHKKMNDSLKNITFEWDSLSLVEWNEFLLNCLYSNILQSWSYGEAKKKNSIWNLKRLAIKHNGILVAVAQVLQLKFGFFKIYRINRGPIFAKNCPESLKKSCFERVSKELGMLSAGRVLFWAPELRIQQENVTCIYTSRFKLLDVKGWSSSLLNLKLDESLLRAQLAGKWRNLLNSAQKNNLEVIKSSDEKTFTWLLENCLEMMKSRGEKFPIKLYQEIYNQMKTSGAHLTVSVALENKIPIAGIVCVPHGNTLTYFLGWSGSDGRRLRGHYLLLWAAIICAKKQGFDFFDLGGIDEVKTFGVANFKVGLGGERYRLIGEGISF